MNSSTAPLPPEFIAVLQEEREQINQRFKMVSLSGSPLDAAAFKVHLAQHVAPIAKAVHECFPERTRVVTLSLVDISLELFRSGYWGKESRLPDLDRLWIDILPTLGRFVARDPQRVVGSLSNGLIQLAQHNTEAAGKWLSRLGEVQSQCNSIHELLDAGRVLAWLCGKADLRQQSLGLLNALPRALALQLLQITEAPSDDQWRTLIEQWERDRWLSSHDGSILRSQYASLRIVQRVGAFTGYGGLFRSPPCAYVKEGQLSVSDGRSSWRVIADCHGCVLRHVGPAEVSLDQITYETRSLEKQRGRNRKTTEPFLSSEGKLSWDTMTREFPYLLSITSQAFDGETLAVTIASSFHVFLIARTKAS